MLPGQFNKYSLKDKWQRTLNWRNHKTCSCCSDWINATHFPRMMTVLQIIICWPILPLAEKCKSNTRQLQCPTTMLHHCLKCGQHLLKARRHRAVSWTGQEHGVLPWGYEEWPSPLLETPVSSSTPPAWQQSYTHPAKEARNIHYVNNEKVILYN